MKLKNNTLLAYGLYVLYILILAYLPFALDYFLTMANFWLSNQEAVTVISSLEPPKSVDPRPLSPVGSRRVGICGAGLFTFSTLLIAWATPPFGLASSFIVVVWYTTLALNPTGWELSEGELPFLFNNKIEKMDSSKVSEVIKETVAPLGDRPLAYFLDACAAYQVYFLFAFLVLCLLLFYHHFIRNAKNKLSPRL